MNPYILKGTKTAELACILRIEHLNPCFQLCDAQAEGSTKSACLQNAAAAKLTLLQMLTTGEAKQLVNTQVNALNQAITNSEWSKGIEGYFYHKTRPVSFNLVVDDFLIKYHREKDFEHLMVTLRQHYTIKCDTTTNQYIGIKLKWNYNNRTCILSMDGYIEQPLCELEHPFPSKPYTSPSYYGTPTSHQTPTCNC